MCVQPCRIRTIHFSLSPIEDAIRLDETSFSCVCEGAPCCATNNKNIAKAVNFCSSTVVQRSDVYPAGQSVRQNIVYFLEHRKKHGSLFHNMYILPDDPSGRVRKNVRSRPAKYI
jgi:hypothetical protein